MPSILMCISARDEGDLAETQLDFETYPYSMWISSGARETSVESRKMVPRWG